MRARARPHGGQGAWRPTPPSGSPTWRRSRTRCAASRRPGAGSRRRSSSLGARHRVPRRRGGAWLATRPATPRGRARPPRPSPSSRSTPPVPASSVLGEGMVDLLVDQPPGRRRHPDRRAARGACGAGTREGGHAGRRLRHGAPSAASSTRAASCWAARSPPATGSGWRPISTPSPASGSGAGTGGRPRRQRAGAGGPAEPRAAARRLALARAAPESADLASLTTDSLAALRAYLEGEQAYRRLAFDSALTAYTRATEVDSTFALAHLRRAVHGWTGGYGSKESQAAAVRASGSPTACRRATAEYYRFTGSTSAANPRHWTPPARSRGTIPTTSMPGSCWARPVSTRRSSRERVRTALSRRSTVCCGATPRWFPP